MRRLLQHSLTRQAERQPDSVAIVSCEESITYSELERKTNQLSRALRLAGCVRGDRVALLLPKSIEALVGIFATLKADCIYVPLDTASPPRRLAQVLEQCESRCVLATSGTAPALSNVYRSGRSSGMERIVWMDGGADIDGRAPVAGTWLDVVEQPVSPLDSRNEGADPAYILFTSGSTGTPKGVPITHSNVLHFVDWAIRYFGMDSSDRVSGHAPLHFDLSTFDIHGAVAAGARLYLVPPGLGLLPQHLAAFMRDTELTQWFSVPSILNHMAQCDVVKQDDFPALRRLLWCGEKCPTPALIHWMRRLPSVSFVNLYGPTETTVASSYYRVPQCPEDETMQIPIGAPCDGEQLYVLDEQLRPVAPGAIGELYIGGVGLSPGYWKEPKKTEASFLPSPFNRADRIYKTGDLAKIDADGMIHLIGRADSQIKSRGYRIELGEIETAVQAVAGVIEAAVVAVETTGFEGIAICCAYVSSTEQVLAPAALRKHLSEALPSYMLPARWMVLDRMPLNGSGKTDRRWLKEHFVRQSVAVQYRNLDGPGEVLSAGREHCHA